MLLTIAAYAQYGVAPAGGVEPCARTMRLCKDAARWIPAFRPVLIGAGVAAGALLRSEEVQA